MSRLLFRPKLALLILPVALGGCAVSTKDQVVGVWTADANQSTLPAIPDENITKKAKLGLQNFMIKLRSDNSFVLTSGPAAEGKYKLTGNQIEMKINDKSTRVPLGGKFDHINGEFDQNYHRMTIEFGTPLGPLKVVLKKTA